MLENLNIGELALMTAVVGMAVVFTALFLLSIYMNVFKKILALLNEKREGKKTVSVAVLDKAATGGKGVDVVNKENRIMTADDVKNEKVAAAVAVGILLDSMSAMPPAEHVAAIAAALAFEGAGLGAAPQPVAAPSTGSWKLAGWAEAHTMRMYSQLRR
ncbi:MAG: hypothetical protein C0609_06285 [Deltaproteobacteria bacterium]|nr:MAG: hypothetical protein C0609_06285 [Deltaproteobacteria bacterium]